MDEMRRGSSTDRVVASQPITSREDIDAIVQREIPRLRAGFVAQLPARLDGIARTWQQAQREAVPGRMIEGLYHMIHNLAAAGSALGLAALSSTARGFELYLQTLVRQGRPPTAEQRPEVERWLSLLDQAAAACRAALGPNAVAAPVA